MIPLQIGNPSPVDVEPGFITAFKCLKAFGYAIHIFTVRPKPFEAEIEAFLKIYGITVGVAAEDEVAAIWSGRAATGEVRDITSKDLEKEAVFKGKMMRLLGGGYDVEVSNSAHLPTASTYPTTILTTRLYALSIHLLSLPIHLRIVRHSNILKHLSRTLIMRHLPIGTSVSIF